MWYLERKINNTFIAGFNELKTMASEAEDERTPPPTPSPSPSSAPNATGNSSDSVTEVPVISASDEVQSWSDSALEAVSSLTYDVDWIKWKANRVSFDVLHDYAIQYGFYRSVVV